MPRGVNASRLAYPSPAAAFGTKDAKNKSVLAAICNTLDVMHACVNIFTDCRTPDSRGWNVPKTPRDMTHGDTIL